MVSSSRRTIASHRIGLWSANQRVFRCFPTQLGDPWTRDSSIISSQFALDQGCSRSIHQARSARTTQTDRETNASTRLAATSCSRSTGQPTTNETEAVTGRSGGFLSASAISRASERPSFADTNAILSSRGKRTRTRAAAALLSHPPRTALSTRRNRPRVNLPPPIGCCGIEDGGDTTPGKSSETSRRFYRVPWKTALLRRFS